MSSSWQLQFRDWKTRLGHMLETKVLFDCSFLVGKGSGQLVTGHKTIVSAVSPVLHDLLKAAKVDHPKVILTDIEPEVFQLMLKYIYVESVDVNSDTVCDLAAAAKAYQIPNLLKVCLDYIAANLTTKNVLQAYSLALHSSENEKLKKKCEEIINTKTTAVLSDSSFEEACLDVVVAVFSLESLDIDSELVLLNAADRYAKHVSKCDYPAGDNLGVRSILEKIRFLSLTPEELAKGRATTTVLSASDACAIMANIAYDKSGVPMPPGFSLRKDPRKKMNVNAIKLLPEIKFTFQVPDVKNFINKSETAWSSTFKLHNLKWKIGVQNNVKESDKVLSIYAYNNWESDSDTWSCKAEIEFSLLRTDMGKPTQNKLTYEFSKKNHAIGYLDFIQISKLLDPNNHYIKDGAITFQVYIKADEPKGL